MLAGAVPHRGAEPQLLGVNGEAVADLVVLIVLADHNRSSRECATSAAAEPAADIRSAPGTSPRS